MELFDFMTRILLAVALGFLIGLERHLTGHIAGIRVNVLVSFGASVFVLFSIIMGAPDVTRIAAQIVTGVGFLCSGIIFKDGGNVRGLNTAATIWCTAAIGVLSSSGHAIYAAAATTALLLANLAFPLIAARMPTLEYFEERESTYRITVVCNGQKELAIRALLINSVAGTRLSLMNLESANLPGGKTEIVATMAGGRKRGDAAEKVVGVMSREEGVVKVGWEVN